VVTVCAENDPASAWQAKVLTYSCLQRQRQIPLIFVRCKKGDPVVVGYEECRAAGAIVAPSYNYGAANPAATLREAAGIVQRLLGAEFLVLMGTDLVWASRSSWPSQLACVPTGDGRWRVPFVVPVRLADTLGATWWNHMERLSATDAFPVALQALGLSPAEREMSQLDLSAPVEAAMIHYTTPTGTWDRDWFQPERPEWRDRWAQGGAPGTAEARLTREIVQARQFYEAIKCA